MIEISLTPIILAFTFLISGLFFFFPAKCIISGKHTGFHFSLNRADDFAYTMFLWIIGVVILFFGLYVSGVVEFI